MVGLGLTYSWFRVGLGWCQGAVKVCLGLVGFGWIYGLVLLSGWLRSDVGFVQGGLTVDLYVGWV